MHWVGHFLVTDKQWGHFAWQGTWREPGYTVKTSKISPLNWSYCTSVTPQTLRSQNNWGAVHSMSHLSGICHVGVTWTSPAMLAKKCTFWCSTRNMKTLGHHSHTSCYYMQWNAKNVLFKISILSLYCCSESSFMQQGHSIWQLQIFTSWELSHKNRSCSHVFKVLLG